ncbi:MAG: CHAD domain-containing protein [Bacteroidota bacterium]
MNRRYPTYRAFGLRTLAARLDIFLIEVLNVRNSYDADAIHDLRVASRRFHAATMLFAECIAPSVLTVGERSIRRIRKSCGAVRDGDVQMEFLISLLRKKKAQRYRSGLERLLLRLAQRRHKRMSGVIASLDALESSTVSATLKHAFSIGQSRRTATRTLPLRQRAGLAIATHVAALFQYEQYVQQMSASKEHHEMRIAAKRLRYVMEIFNPSYGGKMKPYIRTLRLLQDLLGEMHDCDVWLATIPEFIEEERRKTEKFYGATTTFPRIERGLLFLTEYARQVRGKKYRAFVRLWKQANQQQLWKKLLSVTGPAGGSHLTLQHSQV